MSREFAGDDNPLVFAATTRLDPIVRRIADHQRRHQLRGYHPVIQMSANSRVLQSRGVDQSLSDSQPFHEMIAYILLYKTRPKPPVPHINSRLFTQSTHTLSVQTLQ